MGTRTGNYAIGFRRGWSEWQRDLPSQAKWARETGFDAIDLGRVTAADVDILKENGLKLGSVDLVDFGHVLSTDAEKRREAVERNVAYVKEAGALGARAFFGCIIPGDPNAPRGENYKTAVETFAPIVEAAASVGGSLAIEGWPGGGHQLANLCCTPETTRAFIKDLGGKGFGLNYDPSHLIRLGVDHIRFLKEFAPYVRHVHGKDTEIDGEAVYEYGLYQSSAFGKPHGFGEWVWRYTIPGSGQARWTEIFRILKDTGFAGTVSVELEDENFNGSESGEKAALAHSLDFLRSA
jgi:sugar phosphate isomerase/epimerase